MIEFFEHPGIVLIVAALLSAALKGKARVYFSLFASVFAFMLALNLKSAGQLELGFLQYRLVLIRADGLSFPFALIFSFITILGTVYSMHRESAFERASSLLYAGSSIGAVLAGDLFTLFVFLEIMAVSAASLVFSGDREGSTGAGSRYLVMHIAGGLMLLIGIVLHIKATGSIEFEHIGLGAGLSGWLILLGIGVNAAFPLLHTWLPDAYPEGSESGSIFLCAFTTKTAVYALLRGFAGVEPLIAIGAVMVLFPLVYAVCVDDLRRVLSYSLINQIGFMVMGAGIGTELAINGAVAHAFCHILYKSLLFMSIGAVLYRTGSTEASGLGGLWKHMPYTAIFCLIGTFSILAVPLFSGFVSKSMIVSAAHKGHYAWAWFALVLASGAAFLADFKVPYCAFFKNPGAVKPIETKEAPEHMMLAMGVTAGLCIAVGILPGYLYLMLPYAVDYQPYTAGHVSEQLQILLFAALGFSVLVRYGYYPFEKKGVVLDADYLYRKAGGWFIDFTAGPLRKYSAFWNSIMFERLPAALERGVQNPLSAIGLKAQNVFFLLRPPLKKAPERETVVNLWPTGLTVIWITVFLLVYLLLYYFE